MPTSKKAQAQGTSLAQQLTIEELYDALMVQVEPELTHDSIQYINDWHQGESFLEKSVRLSHYDYCFGIVEGRMDELISAWEEQLNEIKEKVLATKNK